MDIVSRFQPSDCQKATEALACEAWNRWIKEEGNVVDDITVIINWFSEKWKCRHGTSHNRILASRARKPFWIFTWSEEIDDKLYRGDYTYIHACMHACTCKHTRAFSACMNSDSIVHCSAGCCETACSWMFLNHSLWDTGRARMCTKLRWQQF